MSMSIDKEKIRERSYKLFLWLLILIILINFAIILFLLHKFKGEKNNFSYNKRISNSLEQNNIIGSGLIDTICPDFMLNTNQGKSFKLSDLRGDVIVFRFFRFQSEDVPQLLYLDHLYNKFIAHGIHIFLVKLMGKLETPSITDQTRIAVPLVEDDGNISFLFHAKNGDVIIIGRDFRIKFKHSQATNRTIYNQVMRYLFDASFPFPNVSKEELSSSIKKLYYLNIDSGNIENIGMHNKNRSLLITFMVAPCTSCLEHQRISIMKEMASEINKEEAHFLLLFGRGNNLESIKRYSETNYVISFFYVGIIQYSDNMPDEEYFKIFSPEVDPRTFIFNKKGDLIFSEEAKDTGKINIDFLYNKIL